MYANTFKTNQRSLPHPSQKIKREQESYFMNTFFADCSPGTMQKVEIISFTYVKVANNNFIYVKVTN